MVAVSAAIPYSAHTVVNPQLEELPLRPAALFRQVKSHASVTNTTKRLLDLCGAGIGLVLLSILILPVAIAIYLDNPGPIFFSQIRYGLNGKPFRIWKFRTMVVNAETLKQQINNQAQGQIFKNENDPRITRVGRFLRKTSLDEFPQFWNVLLGDMSLVGTRPPTREEVAKYKAHHWLRLRVKPGITGEWQTHGRSAIQNFEDIVALDLRYQERWSVGYDLQLLARTVAVVLKRKGAC